MDSNKDEAQLCLQLAETALEDGHLARAKRLLEKSIRMYPLPAVQEALLQSIRDKEQQQQQQQQPRQSSDPKPQPKPSNIDNTNPPPPPRQPTQQMIDAVNAVNKLSNKSHYVVLGLPTDCDQNQIKKSYRKLALKLHPDRNFAPGADDAFKRVGRAFMTLSDPTNKQYYDQTGADEPGDMPRQQNLRRRRTQARQDFVNVNDLSAEELFEFFFAAQMDPHAVRRHVHRQARQQHQPVEQQSMCSRLSRLCFILLFIFTSFILPEVTRPSPRYSLESTSYYSQRATTRNRIPYFLHHSTRLSTYTRRIIEKEVDVETYHIYRQHCRNEQAHRGMWRRKSNGWFITSQSRQYYRQKFEQATTPSCPNADKLQRSLSVH